MRNIAIVLISSPHTYPGMQAQPFPDLEGGRLEGSGVEMVWEGLTSSSRGRSDGLEMTAVIRSFRRPGAGTGTGINIFIAPSNSSS